MPDIASAVTAEVGPVSCDRCDCGPTVLDAGVVSLLGEVVGQRAELPEYGDVVAYG